MALPRSIVRLADKMVAELAGAHGRGRNSRSSVEGEIAEIVKFAEESPEPDDSALWEHVFVNPIGGPVDSQNKTKCTTTAPLPSEESYGTNLSS